MKILGTGLTGLVGSRLVELLSPQYTFENISRAAGVDITDLAQVEKAIIKSDCDLVLHLAGFTDVRQAELDRDLGQSSIAWKVNVTGTENIVHACSKMGKKLIYASTDLVFDGEDTPNGGYREGDKENPLNWYAKTKFEGELRVRDSKTPWLIMRLAYPYRASFSKMDFARFFINKLANNETITLLTDRIITPTFIDDLAGALDILLSKKCIGIYHTVGSTSLSIYKAAQIIADIYGFDRKLLFQTTRKEFLVDRPPEPFNSSLNNAKIKSIGAQMRYFEEGVRELRVQMSS